MPIDDSKEIAVERVLAADQRPRRGPRLRVRRLPGARPAGPRASQHDAEQPRQSVRFTGGIGVVGVFVPEDPGAPGRAREGGQGRFDFGKFWFKGQTMGTGQCTGEALQPAAARPDPRGQGAAVVHRLPRAPARRGAGGATSTSTAATTAGPRSCSIPTARRERIRGAPTGTRPPERGTRTGVIALDRA